jgi:hypothetical protein
MDEMAQGEKSGLITNRGKLQSSKKRCEIIVANALSRMVTNIFVGSTKLNYSIEFFF